MSRIEFELPELPVDWEWMKIGEVVRKVPNIKPELEPERIFRYIDISSIDNRTHRVSGVRTFLGKDAPSRARRPVRQGDVLLSNVRVNLRNTAILETDSADVCSTGFTVLRGNGKVTDSYLFRYVLSDQFVRPLEELQTGTQYPATSDRVVFDQPIPVPPIAAQVELGRIITRLDELVSTASDRLSAIPSLLKKFRQSVLAAAYSGQLTADWRESHPNAVAPVDAVAIFASKRKARKGKVLGAETEAELPEIPASWRYIKLPDLGELNRGKSKHRPRNAPHLLGGPYPLIQTGDVARSQGTITGFAATYSESGLAQSRLWPTETVCITIAANIADTGLLAFPACFPDSVVGFIAAPGITLPRFVELFMRTARANLAQYAPATSQANINMAILEEVRVPLPSLDEQEEIVLRVESLFALADSIESRLADATAQVERTTQSILAKAFRGEL